MEKTPLEEMEAFLLCQPDKVARNVTVITPLDIDQQHLFHISTDTSIRKFVPVIGRRQMKAEDRSVPRICTCPTLLGCFIGYAKPDSDFLHLASNGTPEQEGYKGGWKIYRFPFEAALLPNSKLVPDVKLSDEMWLTLYSPETKEYIPETAGKVFYHSIRYVGQSEHHPESEMELYVEVTAEPGIPFSKRLFLSPGYWKIEGPTPNHVKSWIDDGRYRLTQIEKTEYMAAKDATAALLSLPVTFPAHQRW